MRFLLSALALLLLAGALSAQGAGFRNPKRYLGRSQLMHDDRVIEAGPFLLEVQAEAMNRSKLNQGSKNVPSLRDVSYQYREVALYGTYAIDENWAASVRVPWVDISFNQVGRLPIMPEALEGLGDVGVWAEFSPPSTDITMLAGFELPTGATNPVPNLFATVPATQLQEGMGVYAPFFGVYLPGHIDEFYFEASVFFFMPQGESGAGLSPGFSMYYSTGAGREILDGLNLMVEGEIMMQGRDHFRPSPYGLQNTGSTTWWITPQISYTDAGGFQVEALARFPVVARMNGTQLIPGIDFILALSANF